jgi:ribose transport system ATP-binding protein
MNETGLKPALPEKGIAPPPAAGVPPLSVTDISKSYGVVRALQPASFELVRGEVHALVGENGSGKSTAVGIISGTVRPDSGTVTIGGHTCTHHTSQESQRAGALTVFQDGSVLTDLSVAQNLYLGTPEAQRPSYRGVQSWATKRLAEFGLHRLNAGASAETLSPAERQLLEIVRALMARPTVLLLDEATSALDPAGVDVALDLMRKAAQEGCAVLFVTHRLSEVFRVADRISVLRDGVWQGTRAADSIDTAGLVEMMAGTSVDVEFPDRARPEEIGEVVLMARELSGPGYGPVEVAVRRGEIVGIAGADGNGQLELLRGLGAVDPLSGRLEAKGAPIASSFDALNAGVGFLSSDRRRESLFPSLAIRENLVVGVLGKLSRLGVVSWSQEKAQVRDSISRFGIRLGSPEDPIPSLSGGNQQKVALGRVLATEPEVLLIDEPTQGVDVRSRIDIYHMLRDSARRGLAVALVSSDASELAGLCDRILVVSRGVIVDELPGDTATEERIVHAFAGAERTERDAEKEAGTPVPLARARRFGHVYQDAVRLLLLVVMLVALALYAQSRNSTFLTTPSLYNVLLLALPLAAVAAAQFVAMFTGGIDVSVGATMGVTVALLSFVVQSSGLIDGLLVSVAVAIGVGLAVGIVNATIVERIHISPVIATIATLGILQGVGLLLRPKAAGSISASLTNGLTKQAWIFPIALLVVAAFFVASDVVLRSSGWGLRLRAVGLNPQFASRLGVNAALLRQLSYVGCAVLAALAGVLLAGQVGVGDSTVGGQYTLLSIAAPILGGASLLGGRGTFVGCLLGAVLLAMAQTLPTVLSLSDGASFLLTGGLTLIALLIYTRGASAAVRAYGRTALRKLSLRQGSTPARPA